MKARNIIIATFVCTFLMISTPLEAKKSKLKGITTTLDDLLLLIDLSTTAKNKTKFFIDNEQCQCVCDGSQWSCLDTECSLQENACMDDEISYDNSSDDDFTS